VKILVVSHYFWPENFRVNDLCAGLAKKGHDVTVLTGVPNYPRGKIFRDYKSNPAEFMEYEGCTIIRVPVVPRGSGSSIKLFANYFSYILSVSTLGVIKLKGREFDIIFVFAPSPITIGLSAVILKKIKNVPVIFWVLDLWPETLSAVGAVNNKLALSLIGKMVSFIYNQCDLVLAQSKAFYDGIAAYTKDVEKIKYFPNWSDNDYSKPTTNVFSEEVGVFKVLFSGNIGEAQDFPSILKMVSLVKKRNVNVVLYVVGDGRAFDWVEAEVTKQRLEDRVRLLGRYPLESMADFYSSVDALLVTLKDEPVFAKTIPGKVQSYLAAGKPILTMLSGEGSRIIDEAKCGYIAESGDYVSLADNILKMSLLNEIELSVLGQNSKDYYDREFDRNKLLSQLERWMNGLVINSKEN